MKNANYRKAHNILEGITDNHRAPKKVINRRTRRDNKKACREFGKNSWQKTSKKINKMLDKWIKRCYNVYIR